MSIMWMFFAGLLAAGIAKLLMPAHGAQGIFLLGISGAIIAGVMEYSEGISIGFLGPLVGATALLTLYAFTGQRPTLAEEERADQDDFRNAA